VTDRLIQELIFTKVKEQRKKRKERHDQRTKTGNRRAEGAV
jgi:hypothetical protein